MRLLRPPRVRSALFVLFLTGAGAVPLAAQAIGQGFELERQGRLSDAATVYLTTLRGEPANLAALLGLERVLPGLGRLAELLPLVRRAEVVDTASMLLRAVELRVYAGLDQTANAVAQRADAPEDQHDKMIRALTGPAAPAATRRLGAELVLGWGDPMRAWTLFAPTVATPSQDAVLALRRFADRATTVPGPEAKRVRGLALSRFADFVPGALAVQARATAARALLDAGDRVGARTALERVAADPAAAADAQALAKATLVEILIGDGLLDSAAATLAATGDRLSGEDRQALRYALVRARLARGELDRAEQLLASDSSVDALALKGWVALDRKSTRLNSSHGYISYA